jgi:hypothetical protein
MEEGRRREGGEEREEARDKYWLTEIRYLGP